MLRATLTSLAALALLGSQAWGQAHVAAGHGGVGVHPMHSAARIPSLNNGTGGAVITSNGLGAVSGGFAYNPMYGINGMFGGYGTNAWGGGYGTNGYGMGGYPYGGYNAGYGFGFGANQFSNLPISNGGTVGAARGSDNISAMMNGALPAAARTVPRTSAKPKSTKRKKR
jgi:hypothetical protein